MQDFMKFAKQAVPFLAGLIFLHNETCLKALNTIGCHYAKDASIETSNEVILWHMLWLRQ